VSHDPQHPVEIILARGLMSNLRTPAFLVDAPGNLVYYNDAAGDLLGVRFEEVGSMSRADWTSRFQPVDLEDRPIDAESLPLVIALRDGRPAHTTMRIQTATGGPRDLEVSAFPIIGSAGQRGAMAIFWTADGD
jgi:PAS domain-containing protein